MMSSFSEGHLSNTRAVLMLEEVQGLCIYIYSSNYGGSVF